MDAAGSLCRALDMADMSSLSGHLDDKSLLHVPGLSGLGGDYQGREAIIGVLRRMAGATGGTLHFEANATDLSRRGVLRVTGRLSGTRDGRPIRVTVSLDATLDGQVFRRITIECADRPAWDALWG